MYKIMLAEDEPEVLNAILRIIDWPSFQFDEPVGCCDGQEAIRKLEEGFRPDALITDIRMPFVDGLELTGYVLEHFPKVVVVILSGHDEFAYAQQALKMQVYDYVLKPVTPKSIQELLGRLTQELDARRLNDIEDSMQVLRRHFLQKLSEKKLSDKTVEENCRRHQIDSDRAVYMAAIMDADNTYSYTEKPDRGFSLELLRYALSNMAEELAGDWTETPAGAIVYQAQDGTTRMLVGGTDKAGCRAKIEELVSKVSQASRQHLKETISVGVGEAVDRLGDLYRSHAQAADALSYRYFHGAGSLLFHEDIRKQEGGSEEEIDTAPFYRDFETAIFQYNREAVRDVIVKLFAQLSSGRCPLERCVFCCQRLTMILYHFAEKFGDEQELHNFEQMWEKAELRGASTIDQMEALMHRLCEWVQERFTPDTTDSTAVLVKRAIQYIHKQFADPELSLYTLTSYLSVSVSYFSLVFKSRTGCTFLEYLTKVRMDRAKQLLAFSDQRTYEIADQIGFSDPHYFSVAFKRHTGMSPREFRDHSRRQSPKQEGN